MSAILALQSVLNQWGVGLAEDGRPGPDTTHAAQIVAAAIRPGVASCLPRNGDRDLCGGRASYYGGPDDAGDYYEGQGNMPCVDPDGGGPKLATMTPAEYYARPDVEQFRPYLSPTMATDKKWPVKGGRPVGVSHYLKSENSEQDGTHYYYCALRLYGPLKARAQAGEPVYARIVNPNDKDASGAFLEVVCRVLDWGPTERMGASKWRYDIDLSKGAYDALGLSEGWNGTRYRDHVRWEVL